MRLAGHLNWPGFAQAIRIERTRIQNGSRSTEVSYAITSLDRDRVSAADLLRFNRTHWRIENSLHWVRDVTMSEDTCRARTGDLPENLATLRNASLTLLRTSGYNAIKHTLRTLATSPRKMLKLLRTYKN